MLIYVKFNEKHWFYAVFWRIAENRLQNDCFYIVFWSNGKVMVDFMVCFGSTDPS